MSLRDITPPDDLLHRVRAFMDEHVQPAEKQWDAEIRTENKSTPPVVTELAAKARAAGLWNLFLPDPEVGAGLSNLEYAPLAEAMGRTLWAAEVFNCSAPDTGNMELLWKYGTEEQKQRWMVPLLAGEIRSAYLMTEPHVASSDATNIETTITRDGDSYVINGRKWFATGVLNPACSIWIVMGRSSTDGPRHAQHTQILVEPDAPGVRIVRPLPVLGVLEGYTGHAEVELDNVRVPAENVILGEGRGFEISQGRLGPGRIHHCMRTIGLAERALEAMCDRLLDRTAFGRRLSDNEHWQQQVAQARIDIDMARLLTLDAADTIDNRGIKAALAKVAMIKVAVPRMARKVTDQAIQAFGAAGLTDDFRLPELYRTARWVSIADGPDEVHARTVARLEFKTREVTAL
ncbi:acyl-CoA dehydrogenase family protein [Nocardia cyriacigeorgica]|uniref:acyl-CoA dehydrogenase family protein n=1 Tax=Nocardia cyriacigeorgica TaxID=135487 RepID=UPI0013D78B1A|nr:acyl-CoA dehydrogenase family protein [Nocardia cyriacigeorgica]NEW27076.1 acyl-CoA dehydrogenase [Nocardia cyriacigeorgica]